MKSISNCRECAGMERHRRKGVHGARRGMRGFTLIEILVVVAIITLLASIAVFMGIQLKKGSAEKQTKATLGVLDGAMSAYLKDNAEPGPLGSTTDDVVWVAALKSYPASANLMKPLRFTDDGTKVLDGFSNPIVYIRANTGAANLPTGHFRSSGADGIASNADDIFSTGTSAAP